MKKAAQDAAYLVSCAVNQEKPDQDRCASMNLSAVYSVLQANGLTAAAAFALEQVTELPRAFDQSQKKAIRKIALFDIERAQIFGALENAGIWYLPLKGIVLKDYYPLDGMREMSDNDILCDSSKIAEIKQIMEDFGYTCELYEEYNHDTYAKPPTLEFEIHRSLFSENEQPQYFNYFQDIKDRLVPINGTNYGFHMTDEDFYLYLLCHMYKHYSHAGTGLRSLLDIYVFHKRFGDTLDRVYLAAELKKLQLTDFERDMSRLADKVFTCAALTEQEDKELEYLVASGIYGINEHVEQNRISKILGGDDSKKSKRTYFFSRVFISGETLEKRYPFVYRHKFLYPLLLIYRPIKGIFTHPKVILDEYTSVQQFKEENHGGHNV